MKPKYKLIDDGDGWHSVTEIKKVTVTRKRINSQTSPPTLKKFKKITQKQKIYHFPQSED